MKLTSSELDVSFKAFSANEAAPFLKSVAIFNENRLRERNALRTRENGCRCNGGKA